MKYLNALLQGTAKVVASRGREAAKPAKPLPEAENSPSPRENEPAKPAVLPGSRAFLSCPLTQADNPNPWDAWAPLLDWLLAHYPEQLRDILDAEDALQAVEQSDVTEGEEYEAACAELFWRFEEARRLKMREEAKVWVQ